MECSICGNTRIGELSSGAGVFGGEGTVCADRRACNVRERLRWLGGTFSAAQAAAGMERLTAILRAGSWSLRDLAAAHGEAG